MVKKVKKQPGGVTDKVEDNNSSQGYTELLRHSEVDDEVDGTVDGEEEMAYKDKGLQLNRIHSTITGIIKLQRR